MFRSIKTFAASWKSWKGMMLLLPMLKAKEWPLAICSCISWSERPSNWSIGFGDEEDEAEDEEEGERRDTPKEGKPVVRFWRGQPREVAFLVDIRLL